MTSSGYGIHAFRSDDTLNEHRRLSNLQDTFEPTTRELFSHLGVARGWRCLEVGAGTGDTARYLDDMGCQVVVIDKDLSVPSTGTPGGITWRKGDLFDGWPDENVPVGFDLIHARCVLMHLPERLQLFETLASWLNPGGVLLIGDAVLVGDPVVPVLRELMVAFDRAMRSVVGSDLGYAWQLPSLLAEVGLSGIGMDISVPTLRGGSALAEFTWQTTHQLAGALASDGFDHDAQVAVRKVLEDPSTVSVFLGVVYGWGTRTPTDP